MEWVRWDEMRRNGMGWPFIILIVITHNNTETNSVKIKGEWKKKKGRGWRTGSDKEAN